METAHHTARVLASSTRSSTLSILFRISACAAGRGGGAAGVEPGQVGHFLLGFTVDGGGRARGGGSASSTAISNFRAFFFFFSILDFP
jgi:hypothetical protein